MPSCQPVVSTRPCTGQMVFVLLSVSGARCAFHTDSPSLQTSPFPVLGSWVWLLAAPPHSGLENPLRQLEKHLYTLSEVG